MTEIEMQNRISGKLKTMRDGEIRIIIRNGEIKHINVLEEIKDRPYSAEKSSHKKGE